MSYPWMKIPLVELVKLLCTVCTSNLSTAVSFHQPLELCDECKRKTETWMKENKGK